MQIYQNNFGVTPSYLLKFSGYSFLSDNNFNSFNLTSSINQASGSDFFNCNKRVYVGAERTNITGALLYNSNHKVGSTRVWFDSVRLMNSGVATIASAQVWYPFHEAASAANGVVMAIYTDGAWTTSHGYTS